MSWISVDHSWKVGGRKRMNGFLLRLCLMVMIFNLNSAFPRDPRSVYLLESLREAQVDSGISSREEAIRFLVDLVEGGIELTE